MGLDLCLVCQSLQHAIIQECLSSSDSGVRGGERCDKTDLLAGLTFLVVSSVVPSLLSIFFHVS